jgi:hypothetical protein
MLATDTAKDGDEEMPVVPKTDNIEHIHRIVRTEPGAIAAASVLVSNICERFATHRHGT